MTAMVAVDLGAQSGRVALGRFDGERIAVTEVHRFPNGPARREGRLRWDFEALYSEALAGLRAAASQTDLASVGVDSWAVDFGLLDADGRLLGAPVHYRDERRAAAFEDVFETVPRRELYERTGVQLAPINTLYELAAADPARLRDARRLLLVPDLIHERLCGSRTTEWTNATTTQCFDPRAGAWAVDLIERLGIPARLFGEVVPPGTRLGRCAELGGAEVVAVATHDTASAVAAVPFESPDAAFLSVGTWSLVGVEAGRPAIDDRTFAANLTNEGGAGGRFLQLRNVTGLWLLHEARRAWGGGQSFEELVAAAAAAPPLRSFVDPDDPLFATPGDMPARIAEFCARTGQKSPADEGAVVRCILESLALKHAHTVDLLRDVTGRELRVLHLVGGGARNELLCRWTAAAAELPVQAGPEEATLLGNLLVQAIALGELDSLDDARAVARESFTATTYEPERPEDWREARERFAQLVAPPVEVGV
jgi:rhamnulokinase